LQKRPPGLLIIPVNAGLSFDTGAKVTFQAMLLQTDGRKILLLPAWPKDWDVDFKLYAPYRTVVEGQVRSGKITRLKVTPESRRSDIIVFNRPA